jgi:hypothetical protein
MDGLKTSKPNSSISGSKWESARESSPVTSHKTKGQMRMTLKRMMKMKRDQ